MWGKIKQLLESGSENEQTTKLIEEHFELCPACRSLITLDETLESELKLALPSCAPPTITTAVMEMVDKHDEEEEKKRK